MARKKGADLDSRRALIDAALELIARVGFDAASVDLIVARAGLSKGTFFHFFPAKRDLLDAACERLAYEAWEAVQSTLTGPGDPRERLDRFVTAMRQYRVDHASQVVGLWTALGREENARVRDQLRLRHRELVLPSFRLLVAEGEACGQFDTGDPDVTAALVLEFAQTSADETMRLLREKGGAALPLARRRVNATLAAMERVLGVPPATLARVPEEALLPFMGGESS